MKFLGMTPNIFEIFASSQKGDVFAYKDIRQGILIIKSSFNFFRLQKGTIKK
jgi:hypothetical protein